MESNQFFVMKRCFYAAMADATGTHAARLPAREASVRR
jgi:hypothetical protein